MTRISPTKVVQMVESDPPVIVIMDEATNQEMIISHEEVAGLRGALMYFEPYMGT